MSHSFSIRHSSFVIGVLACLPCLAAPDDEEVTVEAAAAAQHNQLMFAEQNFDQWVFQGVNNAAAGRQRLETQANLRLAEIQRLCQLSVAQKQKLELAARGDLQRFTEQVEQVRRKFNAVRHDQNAFGNLWQEIQPLQRKQADGLMGPESLLMKVLPRTLDPEQAAAYAVVLEERRKFRYRASIANSLITLEAAVALRRAEREALTKLLEQTKPPLTFGQYDHQLVMYRLANLPEASIRPLFDDRQWQALRQQLNQYRGMQSFLIEQGMLTREELRAQALTPGALPEVQE